MVRNVMKQNRLHPCPQGNLSWSPRVAGWPSTPPRTSGNWSCLCLRAPPKITDVSSGAGLCEGVCRSSSHPFETKSRGFCPQILGPREGGARPAARPAEGGAEPRWAPGPVVLRAAAPGRCLEAVGQRCAGWPGAAGLGLRAPRRYRAVRRERRGLAGEGPVPGRVPRGDSGRGAGRAAGPGPPVPPPGSRHGASVRLGSRREGRGEARLLPGPGSWAPAGAVKGASVRSERAGRR